MKVSRKNIFTSLVVLGLATSSQAQLFLEVSGGAPKIGYRWNSFAPFVTTNILFQRFGDIEYADDFHSGENTVTLSTGIGADYTQNLQGLDVGLRAVGTFGTDDNWWNDTKYISTVYTAQLMAIAYKSFGPLSLGGGIGPYGQLYRSKRDDQSNGKGYSYATYSYAAYLDYTIIVRYQF